MGRSGQRVETFAMRISAEEHARLKVLALDSGQGEAAMVRAAVNAWCAREGRELVFRE